MEKKESRAKAAMSGGRKPAAKKTSKKSKGKRPHTIELREAKNGGYIAKHLRDMETGEMGPNRPDEHALGDLDQVHQHLDEHWGEGAEGAGHDESAESPSQEAAAHDSAFLDKAAALKRGE